MSSMSRLERILVGLVLMLFVGIVTFRAYIRLGGEEWPPIRTPTEESLPTPEPLPEVPDRWMGIFPVE
jgi:hypothetical protein